MNIIKRLTACAAAMLIAIGFSAPAQAATFINFAGGAGTFGNDDPDPSFLDTFTFNLVGPGTITITLESVSSAFPTDNVNFNFTTTKFNGQTLDIVTRGLTEFRQLVDVPVTAGVQTITIEGASGPDGTYNGTLAFTSAIPEPAVWALLILGFGATGVALRRRRKSIFKPALA